MSGVCSAADLWFAAGLASGVTMMVVGLVFGELQRRERDRACDAVARARYEGWKSGRAGNPIPPGRY